MLATLRGAFSWVLSSKISSEVDGGNPNPAQPCDQQKGEVPERDSTGSSDSSDQVAVEKTGAKRVRSDVALVPSTDVIMVTKRQKTNHSPATVAAVSVSPRLELEHENRRPLNRSSLRMKRSGRYYSKLIEACNKRIRQEVKKRPFSEVATPEQRNDVPRKKCRVSFPKQTSAASSGKAADLQPRRLLGLVR